MIYLKNNLTNKKEGFSPINKNAVGIYSCGPTVYARGHIGNLRAYVFADLLRRVFAYHEYKVTHVINITDVGHLTSDSDFGEDKVEEAVKKEGKSAKEITSLFTDLFLKDIERLNIPQSAFSFPKATENIDAQIELIKILEEKGFTYKTSDGIYFDTAKLHTYGALGNIQVDKLKEGARVEKNEEKKNSTDFALWKFSRPEEKRMQEWPSPWGIGFPGWHIECSAMSSKFLGQPFDIHTGGIDHVAIHHNNEIAQSEAAYDKKLANFWLHSNHLMLEGQKISKSLGNTLNLDDLEKENIDALEYKYWLLTSHYSSQINFIWEAVRGAKTAFNKLVESFVGINVGTPDKTYLNKIIEKLDDDLDSPKAIALIWEMMKDKNVSKKDALATIVEVDKILGLNFLNQVKEIEGQKIDIPEEVLKLAKARKEARMKKDFAESDRLRAEIASLGFEIKDSEKDFEIREI